MSCYLKHSHIFSFLKVFWLCSSQLHHLYNNLLKFMTLLAINNGGSMKLFQSETEGKFNTVNSVNWKPEFQIIWQNLLQWDLQQFYYSFLPLLCKYPLQSMQEFAFAVFRNKMFFAPGKLPCHTQYFYSNFYPSAPWKFVGCLLFYWLPCN